MPLANDDTSDQEIIDIFVEEAQEVLASVDQDLAALRQRPGDRNALAGIRRGFHTLKGSGRMVKALDLGELAWKVENMLNRAMEGAVPVTEPMVRLVSASRAAIPKLIEAFKTQRKSDMDGELESLMAQADAIAQGQPPTAPAARPAPAAAADQTGVQTRLDALQRALDRYAQRADEALHRSEMALQHVRRLATHLGTMQSQSQDRVARADLAPLVERLNAQGRELVELRIAAKKAQQESAPHPRELLQSIDQRIRDKMAPTERLRSELEHQIEAGRRAAGSARNLAVLALVISLTVGAMAVAVLVKAV